MAQMHWRDLNPRTRRLIVVGGTVEATLKVAALADLLGRTAAQVRGSRLRWAADRPDQRWGLVPVSYFAYGRQDWSGVAHVTHDL